MTEADWLLVREICSRCVLVGHVPTQEETDLCVQAKNADAERYNQIEVALQATGAATYPMPAS